MCKPYLFRDISETSDTRTSTYKLTENILTTGRAEVKTSTPSPGSLEGERGEGIIYSTSPNSPHKNWGGEELITAIFPNSSRESGGGEGRNITSLNSPNELRS